MALPHVQEAIRAQQQQSHPPVTTTPTAAAVPKSRMNKTEVRYALRLEARRAAGEIVEFAFEAITLRLADGVRYTPDFLVVYGDHVLGLEEVKGAYVREDARIKFRVAVEQFPWFRWRWAQWARGEWTERSSGAPPSAAAVRPRGSE